MPQNPYPPHVLEAVRTLLKFIGDDPSRPGLRDTPERFLRAWNTTWGRGYNPILAPALKVFPHEGARYNQMIFVGGISFFSHCEHHLAPFFGTAHVAYLADNKTEGLLGLSKLARIVDHCARKLQVQERLTEEVADALQYALIPPSTAVRDWDQYQTIKQCKQMPSVAVQMRATHMCMVSRGVQQAHAVTVTASLRGDFLNDPKTHSEFLRLCDDHKV